MMSYRLSNERPSKVRHVDELKKAKKKFFFIVEGEKTECAYIKLLSIYARRRAIVEIRLLERVSKSHSNQYKITAKIQSYLEQSSGLGSETKAQILNLLNLFESNDIEKDFLMEELKSLLPVKAEADGEESTFSIIEEVEGQSNHEIVEQIEAFRAVLDYEKDYDEICLLLDRDQGSFKPNQYDEVLAICEKYQFSLAITNPCFEFYLFLHLDDGSNCNLEKVKENKRITKSKNARKYTEAILRDALKLHNQTYRKNHYDVQFFINRFEYVKRNIENYAQDNITLKNEVGSSFPEIVSRILGR